MSDEAIGGITAVAPTVAPEPVTVDQPANEPAGVSPDDTESEDAGLETVEDVQKAIADTEPPEVEDEADYVEEGELDDTADIAEMVEFDFGGNKSTFPKDAFSPEFVEKAQSFTKDLWADYTRKSQANADTQKSLAQQSEALEKITAMNEETLQLYSQGLGIGSEIARLSQIDMNALWTSSPDEARRVTDALAQLRGNYQSITDAVGTKEHEMDAAYAEESKRREVSGRELLDKRIPEFSTKHAPAVVEYAVKQYGIPQAEADRWALNPAVAEWGFKSMLYDRMQAAAKAKPKPAAAKAVAPAKPAGRTRVTDPEKMSTAQIAKHLGLPA